MAIDMARPKGPRKPKYRTVIEKSEDLLDLAREIINEDFSSLKGASIEYVMKTRLNVGNDEIAPPLEKDQVNPGRASAANPVDQQIHHRHFTIQVNGNWWEKATAEQQNALMCHLLCHCWFTEGKPRIVQHEFQGFVAEVRKHGAWSKQLQHFTDAMKQNTLPLEPEGE